MSSASENKKAGLWVVVAGPSGSGKTALAGLIGGWHECLDLDGPDRVGIVRGAVTGDGPIDAAVLLIDAAGSASELQEHARTISILGISQVVVVVNFPDPVAKGFPALQEEYSALLDDAGITPQRFIPVCLSGGAINDAALAEAVTGFRKTLPLEDLPLRLVLQDTFRLENRRVFSGRVETGRLSVGDDLVFRPDGKRGRLKSIETWDGSERPQSAPAGQYVVIALESPVSLERGQVAGHPGAGPAEGREIRASIFWDEADPLTVNAPFLLHAGEQVVAAQVVDILFVYDAERRRMLPGPHSVVRKDHAADVLLLCRKPVAFDRLDVVAQTSRFTISVDGVMSGTGAAREADYDASGSSVASDNITWTTSPVSRDARTSLFGHRGAVVWLTGLSASGKSTLAVGLEWRLHMLGMAAFILDGDNLRHGLCSNLKFSPEDRSENIRRAGETAKLMAEAGNIVVCSLISPYAADRARVREICHRDGIPFAEVFVNTPIEVCEARDPRGLYKKARAGEIRDFTGIGSAYEAPQDPDVEILTARNPLSRCLDILQEHVVELTRPLRSGTANDLNEGSGI